MSANINCNLGGNGNLKETGIRLVVGWRGQGGWHSKQELSRTNSVVGALSSEYTKWEKVKTVHGLQCEHKS